MAMAVGVGATASTHTTVCLQQVHFTQKGANHVAETELGVSQLQSYSPTVLQASLGFPRHPASSVVSETAGSGPASSLAGEARSGREGRCSRASACFPK